MAVNTGDSRRVPGFCGLCIARCGTIATVEGGWWQACKELDMPDYSPFVEGANFNRTVDAAIRDPISGTPEHRANLCEVRPLGVC